MTSNIKITELPAAATLTGAEQLPAVQGGITKRTTVDGIVLHGISSNQLAAAGPVETSGLTITSGCLVGRSSSGVGPVQEITVGAGLSINGGQLQATVANAYPQTGGLLNGTLILQPGTTSAPSLQFKNDTDTGLYHASNDTFGLVTGGAERVRIANAEVTVNPSLVVDNAIRARGDLRVDRTDTNSEGGRLVSRRASDNADGYYWQTFGSSSTPTFRLMRAFGTPTQMLSISDSGAMTVTGPLMLPSSNPTDPNHATRKAYVDAQIASAIASVPTASVLAAIAGAGVGAVGTYAFAYRDPAGYLPTGETVPGSQLRYANDGGSNAEVGYSHISLPGTWRLMGAVTFRNGQEDYGGSHKTSLWLRIA
jgi:hypothetical protein